VTFTLKELSQLGISEKPIEPFLFDSQLRRVIPKTTLQHSPLIDYPIVRIDDQFLVPLPAALSATIRRYVFGVLMEQDMRLDAVRLLAIVSSVLSGKELRRLPPSSGRPMECLISLFQTCGDGPSDSEYSDPLANIAVSVRMPLGGLGEVAQRLSVPLQGGLGTLPRAGVSLRGTRRPPRGIA
jgi:hypothetical protein